MMTLSNTAGFGELIRAGKVNSRSIGRAVNHALSHKKKTISSINCLLEVNKIIELIEADKTYS
jgi:hypothetical protein